VATVKGILRALSTVLSQAVEDELLMANPALRMGKYSTRCRCRSTSTRQIPT
jgi:hypothetical protein